MHGAVEDDVEATRKKVRQRTLDPRAAAAGERGLAVAGANQDRGQLEIVRSLDRFTRDAP
jgi:hypothetical protein